MQVTGLVWPWLTQEGCTGRTGRGCGRRNGEMQLSCLSVEKANEQLASLATTYEGL